MSSELNSIVSSFYHQSLRVSLVVMAVTLVFVSGILHSSTQTLTVAVERQLASVIGASSVINYSVDSVQIDKNLDTEGAIIDSRLINQSTFLVASVLFILLLLTVLNYVLYYLRHKEVTVTLLDFRN